MPEEPKDEIAVNTPEFDAPAETPIVSEPEQTDESAAPVEVSTAAPVMSDAVEQPTQEAPSADATPAPTETPAPVPVSGVFPAQTETPLEQPVQTAPFPPKKKSKKGLIIGLISAGVLAVLIGGSALAYNVWYQNPDKVVTDAMINAITAKSFSATGTIKAEAKDYTMTIEASGRNTQDARSTVAVKVTYTADKVNYTVDGEGVFTGEGDLYLKLNDARKLADSIEKQSNGEISFSVFDGVINKIDGKWIKISKTDLGDFSQEYEKSQQCVADISKKLSTDAAFEKTVEKETSALYEQHRFIVVGNKLGSRTINGQGSLGYELIGDDKAAVAFVKGFGDTQLGKAMKDCNKDIDFSNLANDIEKDSGKSKATGTAQIWVSRFGHTITELNVNSEEDGTKTSMVLNPIFNKNDAIAVPSDAIPFSELKSDIEKAYADYYASLYGSYYSQDSASSESSLFN